MMKQKIVLITGGSSGIGLETAKALRDRGCTVYEMSRREAQEPGISHITGDVTVRQDADHALRRIAQEQGRLDILINNAGFGISGCAELTDPADAARQMQVNFLGCANVCSAALPLLRESGGRIVNLSSVAAVTPIPFQAFYSASKAAINAYTMAACERGKALSCFRVRRYAGGYQNRLYRRPQKGACRGRTLRRPDQPLRGTHGAR